MIQRLILLFILLVLASGCSKLWGGLRADLDDAQFDSTPTYGGRWSEKEYLDRPVAVGHTERSPASDALGFQESSDSWLTPEQADQNRRDAYREENPKFAPEQPEGPKPKNVKRATPNDFRDDAVHTGSLWASDGQTNYYFSKNKVRSVGDIVTINIEQELLKDILTETVRTLTGREKEIELAAAQERLRAKTLGLADPTSASSSFSSSTGASTQSPAASSGKIDEDVPVPNATLADIDLTRSIEMKTGDQILGEIVDRFPNGNYKIRSTKRLLYRNDMRLLTLVGVVRGTDINEEDLLNSGRLYEYRLEILR